MKRIALIFFSIFILFNTYTIDLSGSYILELGRSWHFEIITLKKINGNYLFIYDAPTKDGFESYSSYQIGKWDGEQIVFENIDTIYAIKPQKDGTLHYYAIKDPYEFPGKDFRPITEDDLEKIIALE